MARPLSRPAEPSRRRTTAAWVVGSVAVLAVAVVGLVVTEPETEAPTRRFEKEPTASLDRP